MELPTVRIELGAGGYAVVYKDVLRKTARLHEAELRKSMTPVDAEKNKVLLSELEKDKGIAPKPSDYIVDFGIMDSDAINEIFILNQTVEWSFGPIDKDTLDNKVTREQYKALVKELDRLYKPSPLAG